MNNQQAINLLKGLEQSLDDYCELNDEGKTAFGMAIAALELFGNSERLPSAQPDGYVKIPETGIDDLSDGFHTFRQLTRCGIIIDKDQLIRALTYDRDQYQKGYADAKAEQSWVPCEERLPEENIDVLVCNENGNIEITSGSYSTEVKGFIWYTSGWRFGKVIAWMPLPKSYKREGE